LAKSITLTVETPNESVKKLALEGFTEWGGFIFSPLLIWLSGLSVLFSASFLLAPVVWFHYFARTLFIVKQGIPGMLFIC
jgi:hypothetical protein